MSDSNKLAELRREFEELWAQADRLWDGVYGDEWFGAYVAADFSAVLHELWKLRGRGKTFLEWGSGLGVVAIMASRLGFDAYGIECVPQLVRWAEELADEFDSDARFACGSFIPNEFDWSPEKGSFEDRTDFDGPAAYDQFDMALVDFDIVYAYPWPSEHELYRNIMRECGSTNALFLSYDVREGVEVHWLGG